MTVPRRTFIKRSTLASFSLLLGTEIVNGHRMPEGYLPLAIQADPLKSLGKHPDMTVLNDRPWNIEAKAYLLDDRVTPVERMFIRNNGTIPADIDATGWTLTIDGEGASKTKTYTLEDLKRRFTPHTYALTLECGGNGRSEFNPPAKGNQWTVGAVSCASWTGVRLRDVLEDVGLKQNAVYIGYYGADRHLSGDPTKVVISRGVPISKALQDETLLAYSVNGKDIPVPHGYPLRLVAGGWPASASGKWIHRLLVRDRIHDGPKMGGQSYRVPCEPVPPGAFVEDAEMCIIESMPVKSLITFPRSGAMVKPGQQFEVRGHAWAGELEVARVEYSLDFGATWSQFALERPTNRLAWQHFREEMQLEQVGYYEIWAKATDSEGRSQPMVVPGWNPKGYLNNACHRIAVKVTT